MSKDIHIQAFQFLGGNKGDLEKTSDNSASREWQEIVDKLASKAPNVFPTCPSQREIMQAADLSFINVPMNEPGMRAHTVYFAIQAVGGRFFFNVLCFAYHEGDVSLRELAALAPSDWWRICMQLTLSDTKLTLPEKDTELELPEWDGKKALFFRVPGFGGSVIQGEFEDWREPLNPPSPPPYQPMPTPKPKHFVPIARPEIREKPSEKFKITKLVLAIYGLIAVPVVPCLIWQCYDNWSRVKDEYAANIEKLKDEYAAKIKKLEEENTANIEKLKDEYAANIEKLKEEYAAKIKKLEEENTANIKKLEKEYAANIKKLEEENAAKGNKMKNGRRERRTEIYAVTCAREFSQTNTEEYQTDINTKEEDNNE